MNPRLSRSGVLVAIALLSINTAFARPRLFIIHTLPGGSYSEPVDISADGRVVAGTATMKTALGQAFRQVRSHGPKPIPMNIPVESTVTGLSADGSVVLGNTYNAAGFPRAFRWTKETGVVDLSPDPDLVFYSSGLSGNGQIAVGSYRVGAVPSLPFYWSAETGLQSLSISNSQEGYPFAVNHDGYVIVGYVTSTSGARTNHACRWVGMGEPQLLDPLRRESYASTVTPDGSIIIGNVKESDGAFRPYRWLSGGGVEPLPIDHSFRNTYVAKVSADGQRYLGYAGTTNDVYVLMLWTPDTGPRDMNELFRSSLPHGWHFIYATSMSADGRWIVGDIVDSRGRLRGYILDTGKPQ